MTKHALPLIPPHPEKRNGMWSDQELSRIEAYGQACAEAARREAIEECANLCDELQDVMATEPRHCAEDIRSLLK